MIKPPIILSKMNFKPEEIEIKNLDHLGIVAGIIDEIGIVEKVNKLLGTDERERVNCGEVVKAIILNGLGFVAQPLYLFPNFFKNKAVEHLLGEGIKAEDLNDDKLGRVMDKLYKYGVSKIFLMIGLEAIKKYKILTNYSHLDSTSFHWHGQYNGKAKSLVKSVKSYSLKASEVKGYSYWESKEIYGGIEQRWILVESEERRRADLEKIVARLEKETEIAAREINKITKLEFDQPSLVMERIRQIESKLKYHHLVQIEILEGVNKKGGKIYTVSCSLIESKDLVDEIRNQAGRFILATNVLSEAELEASEILGAYKKQQSAERGFGFLKDPLFFAESLFVKNPERVETMMMLMGLSLLVYTIGQRELRKNLQSQKCSVKNQVNKLTERPTLRWIFHCFQELHCLRIEGIKRISNLSDECRRILKFFPSACQQYYLVT